MNFQSMQKLHYIKDLIVKFPSRYSSFCKRNPLFTITITGSIIISTGDALCQYISYRMKQRKQQSLMVQQQETDGTCQIYKPEQFQINIKRCLEMMTYGLCLYGPLNYTWYIRILPRLVPTPSGKITTKQTLLKVLIDEVTYGPIIYTAYLYSLTRIQGESHEDGVAKVKRDWWTLMGTDLLIWPFILYNNFKRVPIHLQTLVVNFCSVFWSAFMSYVQHQ